MPALGQLTRPVGCHVWLSYLVVACPMLYILQAGHLLLGQRVPTPRPGEPTDIDASADLYPKTDCGHVPADMDPAYPWPQYTVTTDEELVQPTWDIGLQEDMQANSLLPYTFDEIALKWKMGLEEVDRKKKKKKRRRRRRSNRQMTSTTNRPLRRRKRIAGGLTLNDGQFPAYVHIQAYLNVSRAQDYEPDCAGALLTPRVVITSGFCTYVYNNHVRTRTLDKYIASTPYTIEQLLNNNSRTSSEVLFACTHPKYRHTMSNETGLYDMGIFYLKEPLTLSDYVQPACLPMEGVFDGEPGFNSTSGRFENYTARDDYAYYMVELGVSRFPVGDKPILDPARRYDDFSRRLRALRLEASGLYCWDSGDSWWSANKCLRSKYGWGQTCFEDSTKQNQIELMGAPIFGRYVGNGTQPRGRLFYVGSVTYATVGVCDTLEEWRRDEPAIIKYENINRGIEGTWYGIRTLLYQCQKYRGDKFFELAGWPWEDLLPTTTPAPTTTTTSSVKPEWWWTSTKPPASS